MNASQQQLPSPRLLTIAEVADLCRVSEKTVRRWLTAHQVASYRLGGRVLISRDDLNIFLNERRIHPS